MELSRQERILIASAFCLVAVLIGYHIFYSNRLQPPVIVYEPASSAAPAVSSAGASGGSVSVSRPQGESGLTYRSVNLNTADAGELCRLPGVGEVLAGRILERRQQYGPYKSVADIKQVKGIGEKIFEQIEPYLIV